MKIKLEKTEFENGDVAICTDHDHIPFQKVVRELEQIIEIDETKWKKIWENNKYGCSSSKTPRTHRKCDDKYFDKLNKDGDVI